MTIHTRMHNALLTLTQWLSPAFPIGAFAYSHGLETAIVEARITDARTLEAWLHDLCDHGSGQNDIVVLAAAYAGDPSAADDMARAIAGSAERLRETNLQGAAFARTVNAVWGYDLPDHTYPVAVGSAARQAQIPLHTTAQVYLHAVLANLVSAAIRLVPLGQTDGQAVLARLATKIESTTANGIDTPLDAISSACFLSDIAAMRHETLPTRIFRT